MFKNKYLKYKNKYLKYKTKYLFLKKLLGGSIDETVEKLAMDETVEKLAMDETVEKSGSVASAGGAISELPIKSRCIMRKLKSSLNQFNNIESELKKNLQDKIKFNSFNYVTNQIMASSFPTSIIEIEKIYELGINIIVSFCEGNEYAGYWQSSESLTLTDAHTQLINFVYHPTSDAQEYTQEYNTKSLTFFNYPIPDQDVPSNLEHFFNFILKISDEIKKGKKILFHCYAGNGRTSFGIIVLLLILYNIEPEEAYKYCWDKRNKRENGVVPKKVGLCNKKQLENLQVIYDNFILPRLCK